MPRYIGIALTNPVEGKEEEFNKWYDNQHIPDLLAVPGMCPLRDLSSPTNSFAVDHARIATSRFTRSKLMTWTAALQAMPRSDAVAWDNVLIAAFEPIGPKIEKR